MDFIDQCLQYTYNSTNGPSSGLWDAVTHLVLAGVLHDLLVDDLIHDLEALDGLLLCDAHVGLLQGHGAEAAGHTPTWRY